MNILENFGIQPVLLIAQLINFLVVFYILKRFLYKPILETLKNRETTIKTGLAQAEEARVLLEEAAEKERTILKKAQAEAKIILADARKESTTILLQAEEKTKHQSEKMVREAKEQIAESTREAEKRLSQHISELAVQYIERSVEELFTDKDQDMVISHALKTLKQKAD